MSQPYAARGGPPASRAITSDSVLRARACGLIPHAASGRSADLLGQQPEHHREMGEVVDRQRTDRPAAQARTQPGTDPVQQRIHLGPDRELGRGRPPGPDGQQLQPDGQISQSRTGSGVIAARPARWSSTSSTGRPATIPATQRWVAASPTPGIGVPMASSPAVAASSTSASPVRSNSALR